MIKGGCRCGAIGYELSSDPKFQIHCHCTECQKVTGSGHAPIMVFPKDGFALTGEPKSHTYQAESGNQVTHHFCGDCGAPLFNTNSQFVKAVYVLVGSMADPSVFEPQRIVFGGSKQEWDFVDPDLHAFEAMPTK